MWHENIYSLKGIIITRLLLVFRSILDTNSLLFDQNDGEQIIHTVSSAERQPSTSNDQQGSQQQHGIKRQPQDHPLSVYRGQMERLLLRFLLWAQNDACHVLRLLLQHEKQVEKFERSEADELVFWRLNLPLFVLARAIAKNLIRGRSIFQSKISHEFPSHAIKVSYVKI